MPTPVVQRFAVGVMRTNRWRGPREELGAVPDGDGSHRVSEWQAVRDGVRNTARHRQRVARTRRRRREEPDRVPIPRIIDGGRNEIAQVRTGTAQSPMRPEFRQYWRWLVPAYAVHEQSAIHRFVAE